MHGDGGHRHSAIIVVMTSLSVLVMWCGKRQIENMQYRSNTLPSLGPTESRRRLVRLLALRELQVRAVLVVGELGQGDLAPEIGREECVRFRDLHKVNEYAACDPSTRDVLTAAKVAFKKLPIVAVEPFDCV